MTSSLFKDLCGFFSFMSAISLMGLTREIYMYGTQFIAINVGYIIGTPLAAYVFLPVFFRYVFIGSLQVTTKAQC